MQTIPIELSANDLETTAEATSLLSQISKLQATLDPMSHRQGQLALLASNLEEARSFLQNTSHTIAFIGAIGVGKTTAICRMLDLVDAKGDALLSTSSGRTTVCEVEIRFSSRLAISITPVADREMRVLLDEFIDTLLPAQPGAEKSSDGAALTAENQRVVRNMLQMPRRTHRGSGGNVEQIDEARVACAAANSREEFAEQAWQKINWESRTLTELVSEDPQDKQWLKDAFSNVNHGRDARVALPARISVEIPWMLEGLENIGVTLVDTKGLDGNVERKDLDDHIRNKRSIYVACSRFADAPEQAILDLFAHVSDSGLRNRISTNSLLLVLERNDEAAKVSADHGEVSDAEEGRLVRESQIAEALAQRLRLDEAFRPGVHFFNASRNDGKELLRSLGQLLRRVRSDVSLSVHEAAMAIEGFSAEEEQMRFKDAFAMATRQIRDWADRSQGRLAEMNALYRQLVDGITDRGVNASSLRASVNRSGKWGNFDFYYKLASAARKKTVTSLDGSVRELHSLLTAHRSDEYLRPAWAFFHQLAQRIEQRSQAIYDESTNSAYNQFQTPLGADSTFWLAQRQQWGRGPGYRERIASGTDTWFRANETIETERLIQDMVMNRWTELIEEVVGLAQSPSA